MKLVTYRYWDHIRTGALLETHVVDLNRAYRAMLSASAAEDELAVANARVPTDMIALLKTGNSGLQAVKQAVDFVSQRQASADASWGAAGLLFAREQVNLLPPVLRPDKIICLGLNYRAHAAETNWEPPNFPMLFHKTPNTLIGDGEVIMIPIGCTQVDFEGELAIIIGRRGKHIPESEALSYVAGYAVANDVSERELQARTRQFTTGKMADTFCPLGPALVTSDEIPNPNELSIQTTLNGQVMQDSNTAMMIFSVPFIINYISAFATLEPGDVILTGTPEGVGKARSPQIFMKSGDTISVKIERVGTLTNLVAAEIQ